MSLDTTKLSTLALDLIERLAADYEDTPSAEVGVVALVVEIDSEEVTYVEYRCSDQRKWVQAGLFETAVRAVVA